MSLWGIVNASLVKRRSVSFRTGKLSVVLFDMMESLASTKENKDG
jgi:hypothetical protein